MSLMQSMNQILDGKSDKVFQIVAKAFADGGGDKRAKSNIKEEL